MITNYRFSLIELEQQVAVRKAQRRRATNYVVPVPEQETVRDVNIAATDFDHARQQLQDEIRARKFPQRGHPRR